MESRGNGILEERNVTIDGILILVQSVDNNCIETGKIVLFYYLSIDNLKKQDIM